MTMPPPAAAGLGRARLPRWCLPADWPVADGQPLPADVDWDAGRVTAVRPSGAPQPHRTDLRGAPVLPALVDAHTHLDKTFTLSRLGHVEPGLLGAIDAMMDDRQRWTADDVRRRAGRALGWAFDAGVTRLRTHVDWWEAEPMPLAWNVLRELAEEWTGRIAVERVSLMPLTLFGDRDRAEALARGIARSGPGALMGGFIHSTKWDPAALRHLLEAARSHDLDVDLHVDEELEPAACGLAEIARLLAELRFEGRVVCGHTCALAAQDESVALATLDAVARVPITMVSLPITNLLLQDARTGRTPRQRGLTLVKEARERGIPLLVASDNVQDPFCAVGSYDPLEALHTGVLVAQWAPAFDVASETICRADWLTRSATGPFRLVGAPADFVAFPRADVAGWPSRAQTRTVWRAGQPLAEAPR